jgi:two-component system, NtrC family, sensor kinase
MLFKRSTLLTGFLFCIINCVISQNTLSAYVHLIDSLRNLTASGIADSVKMKSFLALGQIYIDIDNDTSMLFAQKAYQLSLQNKSEEYQGQCLDFMGAVALRRGNTDLAIDYLMKGLSIFESRKESRYIIVAKRNLAGVYKSQHDFIKAREYYAGALEIVPRTSLDSLFYSWALMDFGDLLMSLHLTDSALDYSQRSYDMAMKIQIPYARKYVPIALNTMGRIYQENGKNTQALENYRQAVQIAFSNANLQAAADNYMALALLFKRLNVTDSGFYYAKKSFFLARQVNNPQAIELSSGYLKDYFKNHKLLDSAFIYQEIMALAKDSLLNMEKIRQVQNISFNEQLKQEEIKSQLLAYRNNAKVYILLSGLLIALGISMILLRNNRQKQKGKIVIEKAYADLKSTQAQLLQAEKMASLGELTAGIAHEIQNPLNFVNNFSEVNRELLAEMNEEILSGNYEEVRVIMKDLLDNEEKINHHGKRADSIVKGMLQHSQSSTGIKEQTDINALSDEYLRLAYHGLRAKDKSFNATMQTDFDKTITNIFIVPQDISRVLLNLYNNAFYAVNEKKRESRDGYEPVVSVTTRKTGNKVEIRVRDNGNGIGQKVKDKIFQPFFTTKPTGQGTGLGLSLSYDIVKANGGEIKVETKEGDFTEFVVQIPVA